MVDTNSKDKQKILYKAVDYSQRGEKIFEKFNEKFSKTIKDIIQE